MKPRFLFSVVLLLLAAGLPVRAQEAGTAKDKGNAAANKAVDWSRFAAHLDPALLRVVSKDKLTGKSLYTTAFFVSKDGFAVCPLRAMTSGMVPAHVETSKGTKLSFGTVVAILGEQELAVIKLQAKPRMWLSLGAKDTTLGTEGAFLEPGQKKPIHAGPILARRKARRAALLKMPLVARLSVGTQSPQLVKAGINSLNLGAPLIDKTGRLQGVFAGVQPARNQILVQATPLWPVRNALYAAIARPGKVALPLAGKSNPYDPVAVEPHYHAAVENLVKLQVDQALIHVNALLKAHPGSPMAHWLKFDILQKGREYEKAKALLADLTKRGEKAGFDQVALLELQGRLALSQDDAHTAIAVYHKLVEITPDDYPVPRAMLADSYRFKAELGQEKAYIQAVKWYELAVASAPEQLNLLANYEKALTKLRRWEEADKVTDRIFELENLYRRK